MDIVLTRDFKATIVERVRRDPTFAKAMLDEAATLFKGEPRTARLILRDLVNAAVAIKTPSKSRHRMLSGKGNPGMDNPPASGRFARRFMSISRRTPSKPIEVIERPALHRVHKS
jgi:hypothetical protein